MKAIIFPARGAVEISELPEPRPGLGEAVVAVRNSGLCHTDIEILRGNYGTGAYPLVPGHEFVGDVVEIGPGVSNVAVGDRVAVDPNLNCGDCDACKKGWAHLCRTLGAYGVTVNGGFAERCVVRAGALRDIGDMPFELAALAEPMGCVLNGIDMAYEAHMRHALIFGAGPMGLLLGLALQVRGVPEVHVVEPGDARRHLAEQLGMTAHAPGASAFTHMRNGVDLVVDATGLPQVVAGLSKYVANGGTMHLFGVCPQDARIEVVPFDIFRRQLRIVGSHSLNRNITAALNVLRAVQDRAASLVSHRMTLEEVAEVFRTGLPADALKLQVVS